MNKTSTTFIILVGYVISDPSVAQNSEGRLDVFVIGSDHALIFYIEGRCSNSSSRYGYLAGLIFGNTNPVAALNSQGQLQVFVVGPDNSTFYKFQITPGSASSTDYIS